MKYFSIAIILGFAFFSCKKQQDVSQPLSSLSITTTDVTYITDSSALTGGNITDDGGIPITKRGVCWSTSPNPTIGDNHTNEGGDAGIFNSTISGLSSGETYFVRAYALNSSDTAYGNEISFIAHTPKIYVGGNSFNQPTIWVDGASTTLTDGTGQISGGASLFNIYVKGNDIYAAGTDRSGRDQPRAIYWKNGTPAFLTNGVYEAGASYIAVSGTNIYITGFDYEGRTTANKAILWTNGVERTLETYPISRSYALSIALSGSDVYVLTSETADTTNFTNKVVLWKNGIILNEIYEFNAISLTVSGSDIYIAGTKLIENNQGQSKPFIWKNGQFTPLSIPTTTTDSYVTSISISNGGDVYACGFINNGGEYVPMVWKNGIGTPLTISTLSGNAYSVYVYGQDVYVAGLEYLGNPPSSQKRALLWKNGVRTVLSENGEALSVIVK